ncbi:hypothetical protein H5410_060973 [Solanum commersonii]|uniref:Uncharacterized protein n=1 Tax=Solanum commersonii TaxID=4109 RepID=A0A9J5W790_SOLCO|nr:hypothetical protein H5410_060973 [Solanum commersonii]
MAVWKDLILFTQAKGLSRFNTYYGTGNIIKAVYPPQSSFVLPNNTVLGEHIGSLDKKLYELTFLIIQTKNDVKTFNKASTSKNVEAQTMATPVQRPLEISEFKFKSIYDFKELLDKKFSEFSVKPMDLS